MQRCMCYLLTHSVLFYDKVAKELLHLGAYVVIASRKIEKLKEMQKRNCEKIRLLRSLLYGLINGVTDNVTTYMMVNMIYSDGILLRSSSCKNENIYVVHIVNNPTYTTPAAISTGILSPNLPKRGTTKSIALIVNWDCKIVGKSIPVIQYVIRNFIGSRRILYMNDTIVRDVIMNMHDIIYTYAV
jgi:hypothetical protein